MMRKGLSLVEIMIALSLVGGILLLANQLMFQNQTIASRQLLQRQASEDARMTILRMSEVLSQASYIYPNDQVIQLPGGDSQKTGTDALAALVVSGTPYCPVSVAIADTYCAFLYRLEARSSYASELGQQPQASNYVLVEHRLASFAWPKSQCPLPPGGNWTALTATRGIVMDSVDETQTDFSKLTLGGQPIVDKCLRAPVRDPKDHKKFIQPVPDDNDEDALIISAQPKVRVAFANGLGATREEDIAARAAPRGTAANP